MRTALLCALLAAASHASLLSKARRAFGSAALPFIASVALAAGPSYGDTIHPSQADLATILHYVKEEAIDYAKIIESGDSFMRLDNSDDAIFYAEPRLVEHIDTRAVKALNNFHEREFEAVALNAYDDKDRLLSVLDLCASQSSHYPSKYVTTRNGLSQVVGIGMNKLELESNPALSLPIVQDLNNNPTIPLKNGLFDVVTLQLSIDYLTHPTDVLKEAKRVLKKGSGKLIVTFSNRLFITKATSAWTSMSDLDRLSLVCAYLEYAGFDEGAISVVDLLPEAMRGGDPLYAVIAKAL